MKLKMIALAAAMVASTSSIAAIAPGGTGNGELFLAVFDNVAKVSYTLDLGVRMDDFFTTGQALAGYDQSWGLALADGNFASFLSQVNTANLRWAVMASDSAGNTLPGGIRLFTTVRAGSTAAAIASPTNLQLSNGIGSTQMQIFMGNVNATGSHSVPGDATTQQDYTVNGSSVNAEADPGRTYFGEAGGTGPNFNSNFLTLRLDSALGESTTFWSMTRSGTNNGLTVLNDQFNNVAEDGSVTNGGLFTLTGGATPGSYTLNYNLAPVPEASTYAMLLAGLGAVGLIARRRKPAR